MDVHGELRTGKLLKRFPAPTDLLLNLPPDAQIPGLGVIGWDGSIMQYRELQRQGLTRWQPALTTDSLLFLPPIKDILQHLQNLLLLPRHYIRRDATLFTGEELSRIERRSEGKSAATSQSWAHTTIEIT
jgi:hypothetical protein